MKEFKTLVIHPDDRSTDFLSQIYEGKDWTILRDCDISNDELVKLIKEYDRIIMIGHGTPVGLFNTSSKIDLNKRYHNIYFINPTHAKLLSEKDTISIWCHSDEFFRNYKCMGKRKNLHTGMIISEYYEEFFALGSAPKSVEEMAENMALFGKVVGEAIDMEPKEMQKYICEHYNDDDAVSEYNRKNIILL